MSDYANFSDEGSTSQDNLLSGEFPRVSVLASITGGNYKRGSILGKITASGKYTICVPTASGETADGSETAFAILAETVDASENDKQAVVYLTGEFNSAALTAGSGNTVAGLADALRNKGIFLKSNQGV